MIKVKASMNVGRINKILSNVPVASQNAIVNKALPAAGLVAKKAAMLRAPSGKRTGTTQRQTSKSKTLWPIELRRLIKTKVVRKDNDFSYVLIGPERPHGNVANFVSVHPKSGTGNTRRVMLWGKTPKNIPAITHKTDRFIEQAAHESQHQQVRAFMNALVKQVRREMARLTNG